jgi:chromate reductase
MAKILIIPGSNRSGSFNVKLAAVAAKELATLGADVTRISLLDYALPLYDEDLKLSDGMPKNAMKLADMIGSHDGVFIASPEYNASLSPLLKNMIDWVSVIRTKDGKPFTPFKGKMIGLGAASPGSLGGVRGLSHLRDVLVSVGSHVISEQILVSNAKEAFEEDGSLTSDRSSKTMTNSCRSLIAMSHIGL